MRIRKGLNIAQLLWTCEDENIYWAQIFDFVYSFEFVFSFNIPCWLSGSSKEFSFSPAEGFLQTALLGSLLHCCYIDYANKIWSSVVERITSTCTMMRSLVQVSFSLWSMLISTNKYSVPVKGIAFLVQSWWVCVLIFFWHESGFMLLHKAKCICIQLSTERFGLENVSISPSFLGKLTRTKSLPNVKSISGRALLFCLSYLFTLKWGCNTILYLKDHHPAVIVDYCLRMHAGSA